MALIALGLYVAFRGGIPANDSWHTLIWGRELASGRLPDYEARLAPTPHPLLILYAAGLSTLGAAAGPALQLTAMIALGAIAVGLFRLGGRLYGWPVGLLAAAIVLTRDRFLYLGSRGSVDIIALALIVWAAVLEAGRPRRGWPVLALLLLAGLLRPEAWLFAAAYWLWLAPALSWRARIAHGALAAAAPVLWALSDLAVTGNPLWSLNGTQDLAGVLDRRTGLAELPEGTWFSLTSILTPAVVIVGVCGLLGGLAFRRRATLLPVAIFAVAVGAFACLAVFQLPLNQRYLLPAAVVLALLAGVAALGWISLPARGKVRTIWRPAGVLALMLLVVVLPSELATGASVRSKVVARRTIGADLRALVETEAVKRALAQCGPVVAPSNFRRPQLAYLTGRREEEVPVGRRVPLPERGVYIRSTVRPEVKVRANGYGPNSFKEFRRDAGSPATRFPPGYSPLARSRWWIAYTACGPPGSPGV